MSWRVFRRDVGRLFHQRKAWIIVLGVLLTPALYAWFNITAFWDPYGNTADIRVAVVNLDEGATSELTGSLDVGAQVVDQLKNNHRLGWTFLGQDEAQRAVKSGDAYAAIVIPADFSRDLVSITTGQFTQPKLRYYVNEKASAVAPKVTDVGASEIDKQITSAFSEQVAQAATEALKNAGGAVQDQLLTAKGETLNAVDAAADSVASAHKRLTALSSGITASRNDVSSVRSTLGDVDATLGDVQTAIGQTQSIIADAQKQVIAFTDAATTAYVDGTSRLADAAGDAHVVVTELTEAFSTVGMRIDGAIDDVSSVVEANGAAIDRLQQLVDGGGLDAQTQQRLNDVIDTLQARNDNDQKLLSDLKALNTQAGSAASAIESAADDLDTATGNAQDAAGDLRTTLTGSVPELNRAMSALSTSAGAFSAALDAQRGQLAQAEKLLAGLDTQLSSTADAVDGLADNLADIQDGLTTARTDVIALGAAAQAGVLHTITGLDPAQIARFIAAPVEVTEHVLFPIDTYGSAMAALFTNLSLWIGSFVLMVIFKTEVDTEGVEGITIRQAYLGRFLLFAVLAVVQALVVCIGNLVIGVQTVSATAFVGTGVLIALAYISIIYALCVAFGHIGRGLCVLLVIMQIPAASGLYPIEMMPGFFRALYPFLPFTYGIDALRETIAGFYDGHYWRFLGALAVFVVLAWVLGLVLRRRLAALNLMFNRQVAATDLLVADDVQVVGSRYRLTHVIRAMNDRDEFRDDLARRSRPFLQHYPTLLRMTALTAVTGLAALALVAWLVPGGQATVLGIWVAWCLLAIGFLIALEYIRQSFQVAAELGTLDDAALLTAARQRSGDAPLAAMPRESTAPLAGPTTEGDAAPEPVAADDLPADTEKAGGDAAADDLDQVMGLFDAREEPADGADEPESLEEAQQPDEPESLEEAQQPDEPGESDEPEAGQEPEEREEQYGADARQDLGEREDPAHPEEPDEPAHPEGPANGGERP
ncbi:YhgE/Pip family protein [Microbacterium horticulturae]|uniref:YhgE/Pip family protein n=1 Tax=Microbacterium horticulturae TaxID=3028316 RepID=A0ABY8BYJ1_9MICO|nr:YhgE/Pip family protein [Microbacterium sp. KACC 23027]WEG08182.1 YhgE/Pip family protein [Microbacterium sp. KACC 23027]